MNWIKSATKIQNLARVPIIMGIIFLLPSCIMDGMRTGKTSSSSSSNSNSPSSLSVGYGRVWHDNPIILSGNYSLPASYDLSKLLSSGQDFITQTQFLEGSCRYGSSIIDTCFQVKPNKISSPLSSIGGKWAYGRSTDEFLAPHTFWHEKKQAEIFQNALTYARSTAATIDPSYSSAIPLDMFSDTVRANWFGTQSSNILKIYSSCDDEDALNNAFFSPSDMSVCLGWLSDYLGVKFAQDPSVIYHEVGHALNSILFNLRNVASDPDISILGRSDLGAYSYDEAGSISEGLADYHSFIVNKRTHFSEWALGRFLSQSRPMSEDDYLYSGLGINTEPASRLSYPRYVAFDANTPAEPYEAIHYAGQILSHYLVALTKDLELSCGQSHEEATKNILYLLAETMGELGDLTATGTGAVNGVTSNINLDPTNAKEWIEKSNPVNYRSFMQHFTKYLYYVFKEGKKCNGFEYPQDQIEQLLDQYGLLNFKTYNLDGNNIANGHDDTPIAVNVANRLYTTLIPKSLLKLDPTVGAVSAFVFDQRSEMQKTISAMKSSGKILNISPVIPADLKWNNSNGKPSPGEIIGLALNLYNDSNSVMGGVQLLANDWDHAKGNRLCNIFEDAFPNDTAGGTGYLDTAADQGNCNYITRDNGAADDEIAPVCFVQIRETAGTTWYTQDKLKEKLGMNDVDCLDYVSGVSSNSKACFLRAIKGADSAFYSLLDAKKTSAQTLTYNNKAPTFNTGNMIFFEISPDVPPGTTFNCRFRARFTNCDDCWTDSTEDDDDYLDYEYSGAKPFKIINFQFTVVD